MAEGTHSDSVETGDKDYKVIAVAIQSWIAKQRPETISFDTTVCYCPEPCGSVYLDIEPLRDNGAASVSIQASSAGVSYSLSVLTHSQSFHMGGNYNFSNFCTKLEDWTGKKQADLFEILDAVVAGNIEVTEFRWLDWLVGTEIKLVLHDARVLTDKKFPNCTVRSLSALAPWFFDPSRRDVRKIKLPGYI